MWHMFLNHFLDSEAESGVLFSIRPIPGSKNAKKNVRKWSKCSKISNFRNWVCGKCFKVKSGVLRTIPGFVSRLNVTLT